MLVIITKILPKTGLKTSMSSLTNSPNHMKLFSLKVYSPAEINLQKFDITNMKIAQKQNHLYC